MAFSRPGPEIHEVVPIVAKKREQVAALCRRYNQLRLAFFGSAAWGTGFTDASDINLLIKYEPGWTPFRRPLFDLRDTLSELFERDVDVVIADVVKNLYLRAITERSYNPFYTIAFDIL